MNKPKIQFSPMAGYVDCAVCGRTIEVYDWRRCTKVPCPRLIRAGPNVVLKLPKPKKRSMEATV